MLLVLSCAALPRLWAACADQGVLWPDEIYQGPEQAHRLAFGYGFIPWEFREGVRSWIYPGLLGILFKGLAVTGVDDGLALMVVAKCLMALWALVGIGFAMRLAERIAGPTGSLAAGVLLAAFPPSLLYDARCTTEAVSGPLLVAAAFFALHSDPGARWRGKPYASWLAGALAAAATAMRPQNAIVLAGLVVVLMAAKRWKDGWHYAIAAAAVTFSSGLLDAITWGAPFHALIAYLRFNWIEGKAVQFGAEPPTFYADVAWSSVGPAIVAIAAGLVFAAPRAPGPVLIVLAFVLAHSLVPHKELRFLLPVVPLALALSGAGIARAVAKFLQPAGSLADRTVRYVAILSVILGVSMVSRVPDLTLRDLGGSMWVDDGSGAPDPAVQFRAWRYMDAIDRLLARAGRESDLCGLAITGLSPIWTGGYTYLHRDVPYFAISSRELERGLLAGANYVIAGKAAPHPSEIALVASEGEINLYRRDGACDSPPAYYTRVFP